MKLSEIAKLTPGTFKSFDFAKEGRYPLKWQDIIQLNTGGRSHTRVRRYNAFLYGLCEGSTDVMPEIPKRGGFRSNAGRPEIVPEKKKKMVTIGVERGVIASLGGQRCLQKMLISHIKTLI